MATTISAKRAMAEDSAPGPATSGPPLIAQATAPLTAADVLDADDWYTSRRLKELLSIDGPTISEGFAISAYYSQHLGGSHSYLGRQLLLWIDGASIPYTVTDEGRKIAAWRQRGAPPPPAESSPAPSIVDRAVAEIRDNEAHKRASNELNIAHGWAEYVQLLIASDDAGASQDPETATTLATLLAEMMLCLEIPAAQAEEHLAIVRKARQREAWHEALPATEAAYNASREEWDRLVAQHRADLEELQKHRNRLEGELTQYREAGYELGRLKRQLPMAFDEGKPPRLLRRDRPIQGMPAFETTAPETAPGN